MHGRVASLGLTSSSGSGSSSSSLAGGSRGPRAMAALYDELCSIRWSSAQYIAQMDAMARQPSPLLHLQGRQQLLQCNILLTDEEVELVAANPHEERESLGFFYRKLERKKAASLRVTACVLDAAEAKVASSPTRAAATSTGAPNPMTATL
ncbi:hypothetical protein EJB05_41669, partial [Eragrostis curvula]